MRRRGLPAAYMSRIFLFKFIGVPDYSIDLATLTALEPPMVSSKGQEGVLKTNFRSSSNREPRIEY